MTIDEFLEHHGVKGMHWGIRNQKSRVKSARKSASTTQDYRKTAELRKRKKSQLTNKQLDAVNARLTKEQNFSRLNPGNVKKGHDFIKNALAALGTATAVTALVYKTPAGKKAISIGTKFIQLSMQAGMANSKKIDLSKFQKSAQGKLF